MEDLSNFGYQVCPDCGYIFDSECCPQCAKWAASRLDELDAERQHWEARVRRARNGGPTAEEYAEALADLAKMGGKR